MKINELDIYLTTANFIALRQEDWIVVISPEQVDIVIKEIEKLGEIAINLKKSIALDDNLSQFDKACLLDGDIADLERYYCEEGNNNKLLDVKHLAKYL